MAGDASSVSASLRHGDALTSAKNEAGACATASAASWWMRLDARSAPAAEQRQPRQEQEKCDENSRNEHKISATACNYQVTSLIIRQRWRGTRALTA